VVLLLLYNSSGVPFLRLSVLAKSIFFFGYEATEAQQKKLKVKTLLGECEEIYELCIIYECCCVGGCCL
jgi:hypothetical protein